MSSSIGTTNRTPLGIVAQVVGALVGGIAGAVVLFFLAWIIFDRANLGMGMLTVQAYAVMLGFGLGTGPGAALAGRLLRQPGNLGRATLFGLLGGLLGVLVLAGFVTGILRIPGLRVDLFIMPAVIAALSVVAAIIGYNMRPRATPAA
jgi:hypothetical protein